MNPHDLALVAPAAAFVFGAAIGSFLNVVIYRIPRSDAELLEEVGEKMGPHGEKLSVFYPSRSFCPQCHAEIRARDNIPLLSYFLLLGRCRSCRAPIPFRYFFVELLTATLFAFTAYRFQPDWAQVVVWSAFGAAMIAISFIDLDFKIIPDRIDVPGMIAAPLLAAAFPQLHQGTDGTRLRFVERLHEWGVQEHTVRVAAVLSSLIGIAMGAGVIYLIARLGSAAFRKEAMGLGDVKLLGMIGGFLGMRGVLLCLLMACVAGAAIGIVVKVATKAAYIPFGPFLALGALVAVYWDAEIVYFLTVVYPAWVMRK